MGYSARHVWARWRKNLVTGRRHFTVPRPCRDFGYSAPVNAEPRCNIMLAVAAPKHSFHKGCVTARKTDSACVSSVHRPPKFSMAHRIGGPQPNSIKPIVAKQIASDSAAILLRVRIEPSQAQGRLCTATFTRQPVISSFPLAYIPMRSTGTKPFGATSSGREARSRDGSPGFNGDRCHHVDARHGRRIRCRHHRRDRWPRSRSRGIAR